MGSIVFFFSLALRAIGSILYFFARASRGGLYSVFSLRASRDKYLIDVGLISGRHSSVCFRSRFAR